MMNLLLNKPPNTGNEKQYVLSAMESLCISGDGHLSQKCHQWLEDKLKCKKELLTTSCTHALEMAAMLIDIDQNDCEMDTIVKC